jgi:hypothetical protein
MSDVVAEAVARKLTKQQREALLAPCWPEASMYGSGIHGKVWKSLAVMGLISPFGLGHTWEPRSASWRLSLSGARVRAVLLAEARDVR